MCRVLGVSERGFHAWRQRGPSGRALQDVALLIAVRASHERSGGTYDAPRIHEDLREAGYRLGRKRIARLLRREGLTGVSRRRGPARERGAWHRNYSVGFSIPMLLVAYAWQAVRSRFRVMAGQ